MSVSLGGLVVSSVPVSLHALSLTPSMFYATVFLVAAVVFAYLTNPSESSFRAFLTEQSFRHHLTRLDDSNDSKDSHSGVYFSRSDPRFHFANRASVAIRTPAHLYHNFVLFTVALVVPSRSPCHSDPTSSDTWFLGAFGGWWRGGPLHTWWVDAVTHSKEEEGSRSGVLDIKNLDNVDEYNVLPFSSFQAKHSRGSPPRLRDQQRRSDHSTRPPVRSASPPPLPKSVSLPLHSTTRHISSPIVHSHSHSPAFPSSPSVSSANLFDQSPAIAELLRQITTSRAAVHDLRSQLGEFQSISNQQRNLLHTELEQQRERKRDEDSTRVELKSKTKNLEDAKRNAEGNKRDVDKKLKSVEVRRDDAARKIEFLKTEIQKSKLKMEDDQTWIVSGEKNAEAEELEEELEKKKVEIKVAEDVVVALSLRAKDLENRIAEERERLKKVVEEAHLRRIRQQEEKSLATAPVDDENLYWPPAPPFDHSKSVELDMPPHISPRRKALSLDTKPQISTFAPFDDVIVTPTPAEGGLLTPSKLIPSSLIRSLSGGGTPPDMELSRSFQSESDPFIIRTDRACLGDWRGSSGDGFLSSSPNSLNGPRFYEDTSYVKSRRGNSADYFDSDFAPSHHGVSETAMDHQRAFLRIPNRNSSDLYTMASAATSSPNLTELHVQAPPRRWFSVKDRKTLNPQAEEFNIISNPLLKPPAPGFDALNPSTGLSSTNSTNTNSTSTFFYKAFAPSPAERAALGVSVGRASLERLPSLSDVGSLNTSPVLATAELPAVVVSPPAPGEGSFARSMAWLNSLPRRKPKFSPWDDDEH